jgi:hypothetical protein
MGLDDIEWYETPTNDEEVLEIYYRSTGEKQYVKAWSTWGRIRKLMWCLAWIPAFIWGAVLGLIAILLCVTVVGIPIGFVVFIYAGAPGGTLVCKALNTKVKNSETSTREEEEASTSDSRARH